MRPPFRPSVAERRCLWGGSRDQCREFAGWKRQFRGIFLLPLRAVFDTGSFVYLRRTGLSCRNSNIFSALLERIRSKYGGNGLVLTNAFFRLTNCLHSAILHVRNWWLTETL